MSGLDQLKQASTKRKGGGRTLPPPRHKPRQDQVELPVDDSTPQADQAAPPQSAAPSVAGPDSAATPPPTPPATATPSPAPAPAPEAAAPRRAAAKATAAQSARKVGPTTMYFDAETDDWLEDVLAIGRRGTPKVSSKSAIARLAIRELAKRMSAEQVVAEIRRGAVSANAQPGRPKL